MKPILNTIFEVNAQKVNAILARLTVENSQNRINPQTGTAGFYMRHIAEAQIMLSKEFFGSAANLPYGKPFTLGVAADDGRLYDVEETKALMESGYAAIQEAIKKLKKADWDTPKPTRFFGDITPLQGFSRLLNHNAHHCGQIELAIKKGEKV
ncbi:MAG: DinB family protein [Saprospiraceae bacterium]|nr:DinB family protein [Saprospiraceae bacterium]